MANKKVLERIAAAVEDAEATPDDQLDWMRHQELRNPRRRCIAFAFQSIGLRSCASWPRC